MKKKIFISYSSRDEHLVPLLVRLLEHHGFEPWYARTAVPGGVPYDEVIYDNIRSSQAMIVVVSENAVGSDWVKEEVVRFRSHNSRGQLIPLRVGPVDLGQVHRDLERLQAIDLSACWLKGLKKLFRSLNAEFLPRPERTGGRRVAARRKIPERRHSSVAERIETGFVLSLARELRTRGHQPLPAAVAAEDDPSLKQCLLTEASRYTFHDAESGEPLTPEQVIDRALREVAHFVDGESLRSGVRTMAEIAQSICSSCDVEMVDRRESQRRPTPDRRSERASRGASSEN